MKRRTISRKSAQTGYCRRGPMQVSPLFRDRQPLTGLAESELAGQIVPHPPLGIGLQIGIGGHKGNGPVAENRSQFSIRTSRSVVLQVSSTASPSPIQRHRRSTALGKVVPSSRSLSVMLVRLVTNSVSFLL